MRPDPPGVGKQSEVFRDVLREKSGSSLVTLTTNATSMPHKGVGLSDHAGGFKGKI